MCFSATASFSAAAIIGGIGALTLRSAARRHQCRVLPFALFPSLFAVQQLVEGLLWLELDATAPGLSRTILIHAFQGYAEVFWPVFAPLSVLLIEPERRRRRLILLCLAVGTLLSAYLLAAMISHPYDAFVSDGHIVYRNRYRYPSGIEVPYVVATTVSLLLSSHRTVRLVGAVILAGFAAAYIFYYHAYISVWCYFAAAASTLVYFHVRGTPHRGLIKIKD